MKPWVAPTIFFLSCLAPVAYAGNPKSEQEATAKAALIERALDQIIWYDAERKAPLLIPESVVTSLPIADLPVPSYARESLSMWISFIRDWKSPTRQPYPECTRARRALDRAPVPEEEQTTLEKVIEEGAVSILVAIDKITKGYWPREGIYQYNQYSVLRALKGANFRSNPMTGGAFLTEGGEIVIEGTRLCTLPSLYEVAPLPGETYLLIGAPDENGIFYEHYYFRVKNGQVDWADYRSLRKPTTPPQIDEIATKLLARGEANE